MLELLRVSQRTVYAAKGTPLMAPLMAEPRDTAVTTSGKATACHDIAPELVTPRPSSPSTFRPQVYSVPPARHTQCVPGVRRGPTDSATRTRAARRKKVCGFAGNRFGWIRLGEQWGAKYQKIKLECSPRHTQMLPK